MKHQRGLALVAVLWMLAALSLLAFGVMSLTRASLRAAGTAQDLARAAALGDGAIQLAIRDYAALEDRNGRLVTGQYALDGFRLDVQIIPSSGLVDLNHAGADLLQALLSILGGLDEQSAAQVAANIIAWRTPENSTGAADRSAYVAAGLPAPRYGRFQCAEDLLQVLGMRMDIFDKIRDFVSVYRGGGAGINPLSAPPQLLLVLSHGDQALATQLTSQRDAGETSLSTTGLERSEVSNTSGSIYRVDADLVLPDGRRLRRSRWLNLNSKGSAVPVRTLMILPVHGVTGGES